MTNFRIGVRVVISNRLITISLSTTASLTHGTCDVNTKTDCRTYYGGNTELAQAIQPYCQRQVDPRCLKREMNRWAEKLDLMITDWDASEEDLKLLSEKGIEIEIVEKP